MSSTSEIPFHLLDRPFEFEDIYRMSYNIFPIIGMVLTIVLSILGSLATGGIASNTEDLQDYIHPLAWRFCCRKSKSQPHQENYKMKEVKSEPNLPFEVSA